MNKFKVGDKVVFHNITDTPAYRKYDGQKGTIALLNDAAYSTSYPYAVQFERGKLPYVEEDELTLVESHTTERVEYRTHFTYPYLEQRGESRYGPPAKSIVEADSTARGANEGYYWAGKTLGHQKRTVIETEWEDVEA